jgi:predicted metal-binding protein
MSKPLVHVFLCTGKDCSKAWRRLCDGSPGKWLKRRVEEAGLPYKLNVIKTECMDRCDDAACLCFEHHSQASFEINIRSAHDADRLLAALRACVESAADGVPQRIAEG